MPSAVNMLTAVQTAEVSLVKRGANNKRFALTKSEEKMPFNELAKTVLEVEAEGESKLVETLKASGVADDVIDVAVANFRIQSGFKDKLSKDAFDVVAKSSGYATAEKKAEEKVIEKAHTPIEMPEEMRKAFDDQQAELVALRKEAAEKDERIKKIEKAAALKEYITKCESQYSHVPGLSSEEMGDMLQKAYAISSDMGQRLEKTWAETSQALKKSRLLAAQGVTSINDGSGTAWGKMETLAKELVLKTNGLSNGKAMKIVMEQNPELYQEYLNENPAQQGRR